MGPGAINERPGGPSFDEVFSRARKKYTQNFFRQNCFAEILKGATFRFYNIISRVPQRIMRLLNIRYLNTLRNAEFTPHLLRAPFENNPERQKTEGSRRLLRVSQREQGSHAALR